MTDAENVTDARFGITAERGFLPREDPIARLPSALAEWDELASNLPKLMATGRVRAFLERPPVFDVASLTTQPDVERAMLILCRAQSRPRLRVVLYCLLRFPDRRHSGACAGFDVDVNEDEPFLIDAAGEVLQQHDVAKRDGAVGINAPPVGECVRGRRTGSAYQL